MGQGTLLSISNVDLVIEGSRDFHILHGVNLNINKEERLGVVGESGSGKTMLMRTIVRLLPRNARLATGNVLLEGTDLWMLNGRQMRDIRGREIAIMFQDAPTSLNPVYSVGAQVADVYRRHRGGGKKEAWEAAVGMLDRVSLPNPSAKSKAYPHELSGGMCQRVIVAMALICSPKLLIADEATSGLDVTIQSQVLELILDVIDELGAALVFVSHDIGIVSRACSTLAVMYGGAVVEYGVTEAILSNPYHPYTAGLIDCYDNTSTETMAYIPGVAVDLTQPIVGCPFESRCHKAMNICRQQKPLLREVASSRTVACHLFRDKFVPKNGESRGEVIS